MEGEADARKREILPLVPAAAAVSDPDSPLVRLICRAGFAPTSDPLAEIKTLRVARFAVDEAPPAVQRRRAAWPHSSCCPLSRGATHAHQAHAAPTHPPSRPTEQPALNGPPATADGLRLD